MGSIPETRGSAQLSPGPANQVRLATPEAPASDAGLAASVLFHLNLNYSAIEVEERATVVERCYRPLLGLCDALPWLVIALEAPLSTLQAIESIDPPWIARLRALIAQGRVELIGSGDTQLAGPLVPAAVNAWNQELGQRGYEELVGVRPTTALIGEMAFSQGLVDAYLDAGYDTLITEWNNPHRTHPHWQSSWRFEPAWTPAPSGRRARLLWVDTLAFQKFQRVVMGELARRDYQVWLREQSASSPRHMFLYAGDAEVFGFRPGRYATEPGILGDEWQGMAELLGDLECAGLGFTSPRRVARDPERQPVRSLPLSSALDPIPVKKQLKYNVTRWAVTGRGDLNLNTRCHARAKALLEHGGSPEEWREVCRAWASDFRTHLTERRWQALEADPAPTTGSGSAASARPPSMSPAHRRARVRREADAIRVQTDGLDLTLNARRGLAIECLSFAHVAPEPLVGTLPQGVFEDIEWAADFYSAHTVLEVPARRRVTDLERVEPRFEQHDDHLAILADVPTSLGTLPKSVRIYEDRVELGWGLSAWGARPLGTLRTGYVTLLPDGLGPDLYVTCANGGAPERFAIQGDIDHGAPVSALISARTGFGATDGRLVLDDGRRALVLRWDPARCAALPLLTHRLVAGRRFCRLAFSLGEVDETLVRGAPLLDFALTLAARPLAVRSVDDASTEREQA